MTTITRSEFNKLSPQERLNFVLLEGNIIIDDSIDLKKWCCKDMAQAICHKEIFEAEGAVYIYGKPEFANDGECIDDMTSEIKITFCPFCGRSLQK